MTMIEASEQQFLNIRLKTIGFPAWRTEKTNEEKNLERFRSAFGVSPKACAAVFRDLQLFDIGNAKVDKPAVHKMLMALYWLKTYQTETVISGLFHNSEETVRKWNWAYCKAFQALKSFKVSTRIQVLVSSLITLNLTSVCSMVDCLESERKPGDASNQ
jgi:hypothetical protein